MDLKRELRETAIQITCYDRNGEIVRRVTSADDGTVEDLEGSKNGGGLPSGGNESDNESGNESGNTSFNTNPGGLPTGGNESEEP